MNENTPPTNNNQSLAKRNHSDLTNLDPSFNFEADQTTVEVNVNRLQYTSEIQQLHDLYDQYLNRSQPECLLYSSISDKAQWLSEIYEKQSAQVDKIMSTNENWDFKKTRIAYVINKYMTKIETYKNDILEHQQLLTAYQESQTKLSELPIEVKHKLNQLVELAWTNYQKTLETNKDLRNHIIGYENKLATANLNKLLNEYHELAKKEIDNYLAQQLAVNDEINLEYNEVMNYFKVPGDQLTNFTNLVKTKLLLGQQQTEKLKHDAYSLYQNDVLQIDQMVVELKFKYTQDLAAIFKVVNRYKQVINKRRDKFNEDANLLVTYIQKVFEQRVHEINDSLAAFEKVSDNARTLNEEEIAALLQWNRQELNDRIERLKRHYANIIKPLSNDYHNMVYLLERDHPFDKYQLNKKMAELKDLEHASLIYLTSDFEKQKHEIEKALDEKYQFISDELNFTKEEVQRIIAKFQEQINNLCLDVVEKNEKFWLRAQYHFLTEAKKLIVKHHYDSAPWVHVWNGHDRAWMHEYLVTNLSAEYLAKVGECIKPFSPQGNLFLTLAKALVHLNEKRRDVYKKRDEVEYAELINLNTLPVVNIELLRQNMDEALIKMQQGDSAFSKKIAAIEEQLGSEH